MKKDIYQTACPPRRAVLFFLVLSLFFTPFGFAVEDPYLSVKPNESIYRGPEFVPIDDFNSGKENPKKEERWIAKTSRDNSLKIKIVRGDARNPDRGHSLQCRLKINPRQSAQMSRALMHMDVSQATHFLMKTKTKFKTPFPLGGKITFWLRDRNLLERETDITESVIQSTDLWTTISIPLNNGEELDWDQMISMGLRFTASDSAAIQGQISFDELTFYGQGNVNFESAKDNIHGFPGVVFDPIRRKKLVEIKDDQKLLREIAKDTWKFFKATRNKKTQLIVDNIKVSQEPLVSGYTSPTNIAMDILATISAMDLKLISRTKAVQRTQAVISTLMQMKREKGFFFNFYETKNLIVTRPYISSVDNGWLALSLVIVRQAFASELGEQATQLLNQMNFDHFLDSENNQLIIGYDYPMKEFGGPHYGMLVSEARATSLLAIGKGDVPEDHWWFLYRTPPSAWKWQAQVPQGVFKTEQGIDYFQGHYLYKNKPYVPSWGGSLFEYLMPTLIIDEKKYAPHSFAINNLRAVENQQEYALVDKQYPLWGISPSATENGRSWKYEEFGIKELGVKGYPDRGVVTPHVSFLALSLMPEAVIKNIRKFLDYETYGPYGFYDTLNLKTGRANALYLSLDQGMILVALGNYLGKDTIPNRFHRDPIGKRVQKLLEMESFF